MTTHLKSGDPAPDFSAPGTDGSRLSLADFRGQNLVMFIYPRDDSLFCTKQACSLPVRSAAILGVSAQDEGSHQKFAEKYGLKFPLLADTDLAVAKAYGVAGSGLSGFVRGMMKASERVTFIIDECGANRACNQ